MSNVKEKEGYPLMEKPQPQIVPGSDPGFQPPPYSSLIGSQSQEYNPLPSAQTQAPYPAQIHQDTPYNPMNQVTQVNGKPNPPLGFNSTYAPTTYDPMVNAPPVNQEAIPNQTVIVSSQTASSSRRAKRCRYLKFGAAIGTILVALGVGIRIYNRTQHNKEVKKQIEDAMRRERERTKHYDIPTFNDYDALQREFVNPIIHKNDPYNNRYRRMVRVDEIERFKDYDFLDSNDRLFLDKLFKPKKSYRQRRDTRGRIKAGTKKVKIFTKRKCLGGLGKRCN